MRNYIMFAALFWLLILSIVSYALAHGNEADKERYAKVVVPFLILAWVGTAGIALFEWIKVWLVG